MAEKVTTMVLKVDLQCPTCYKKIKKLLCKFPQIRNQVYDEKQNTVTITVVSCNPEKIRGKLCCKGGKTIKSIEIVVPKPPEKPKPKPEEPEKPKPKPKEPEKPKPKEPEKTPDKPKTPTPAPAPAPAYPVYPVGACCGPCSGGYSGGPCYHGHGRPVPWYDSCGYGPCGCGCGGVRDCGGVRRCGCGCGGVRGCYVRRPCDYFSDENTSGCTIM